MIRAATPADIDPIVAMCAEFIAEGTYLGMIAFERARFERLIAALVASNAADVLVTDRLNGMIAMVMERSDLTGDVMAGELFWWVRPGARGVTGWRLQQAGERWARERGATIMRMAAPDENVGRMLERNGFKRAEIMYQKGLT